MSVRLYCGQASNIRNHLSIGEVPILQVLLAIPQNIPIILITELLKIVLEELRFQVC